MEYHIKTDFNWWLKWLACVVTLTGATLTSAGLDPYNVYLLNVGATLYLIWSIRIKEWSLVVINAGLIAIYCAGTLYRILN
jgi:hypothetical protein